MAKDPAFLFYYDRFQSATITMTDEEVGQYIRLMCIQANKGYVSQKDMLHICKTLDNDVCCKFAPIGDNKFANAVLIDIMNQRKAFTESRRNNRKGKKENISKTHDEHVVNKDVNVIVDVNKEEFIIVSEEKVFDALPVLEFYEAQLNGMQKENGNISWKPLVLPWMKEHIGEEFTDAMHAKNSFKRYYMSKKEGKFKNNTPQLSAEELYKQGKKS